MEAARRGDRNAFNELVRSTYRDIYSLAYRLTGNREDAGDVVQDAYVRAYRAIRRFRGDSSFSTWMYRITSNCASTDLSRRTRQRTEELSSDAPIVDLRPEQDPSLRPRRPFCDTTSTGRSGRCPSDCAKWLYCVICTISLTAR